MIEGNLEELLRRVEISPEQEEKARLVNSGVVEAARSALGAGVQVYSIGSSNRETYVPNEYGLPGDVDLYIVGGGERDLATLIGLVGERKGELEANLSEIYRRNVELKLWKAENNEGKAEEEFVQARYEAVDKKSGEVLLGLDFNYSGVLDGPERYPEKFNEQIAYITANLKPEEREEAREWVVSNIRGLKYLLSEEGIYKSKEGGFGGVGVEQLMLQLGGDVQYNSLEEIKAAYTVGRALKQIEVQGKGLQINHPISGDDLTEKLSRNEDKGWAKLLGVAREYQSSFMYEGSGLRGGNKPSSTLDGRVKGIYLSDTVSDRLPSGVSAPESEYRKVTNLRSLQAPAYA